MRTKPPFVLFYLFAFTLSRLMGYYLLQKKRFTKYAHSSNGLPAFLFGINRISEIVIGLTRDILQFRAFLEPHKSNEPRSIAIRVSVE